jgi:hypothetical protein
MTAIEKAINRLSKRPSTQRQDSLRSCIYSMLQHKCGLGSLFLLLSLFACSNHSHWTSDLVYSDRKEFCSTKLSYLSSNPIHGIDLEFLKIGQRLNVYLNVHSVPVPAYRGNQKIALLKLDIDGEILDCETYRLEGGQRFLLPQEIVKILIESLQNHKDITLILPGYRSTVKAEDFTRKFFQLNHPFPLQNPFHLPI